LRSNIWHGLAIPLADDLEVVTLAQLEHLVCGRTNRERDYADGYSAF
jgi:hypothetical protein